MRYVHFPVDGDWEVLASTIVPTEVDVWSRVDADNWAPFACPCCSCSLSPRGTVLRYDVFQFVEKKDGGTLIDYCVAGVMASNPLAFMAAISLVVSDKDELLLPVQSSLHETGSGWEVWTRVLQLHRGQFLQVLADLFLRGEFMKVLIGHLGRENKWAKEIVCPFFVGLLTACEMGCFVRQLTVFAAMVVNKSTNQIIQRAFQKDEVLGYFIQKVHAFLCKVDDENWSSTKRFLVFTVVLTAVCHKKNMEAVREHMELIEFMCKQTFVIGVIGNHAYPFHFVLDACKRMILSKREVSSDVFVGSDLRGFFRHSMMM